MDAFWNTIKGHVANMLAQQAVNRHAIVASVNPANNTVRVILDEEGTLSGPLPVAQMAAGANWSSVCLPVPGTQVLVLPDMGDQAHGVVVGAVHFDRQPPGKVTPYGASSAVPLVPGEITFQHASGASLRLTAGGVIEIHGTLKISGDLLVNGDISDKNAVHGTLDLLRTDHNLHTHSDPQGGSVSVPNLVTP